MMFSQPPNHRFSNDLSDVAASPASGMTTIAYSFWRGLTGTVSGIAAFAMPSAESIEPILRDIALVIGGVIVPAVTGYSIWLTIRLKKKQLNDGKSSDDSTEV